MCLAIPGKIECITEESSSLKLGKVNFGGIIKEVNLTFVPESLPGDYVIVHAGVAIHRLDIDSANKTLSLFENLNKEALEPHV